MLGAIDKNRRAMDKARSVFKELTVYEGGTPASDNHNWGWHMDSRGWHKMGGDACAEGPESQPSTVAVRMWGPLTPV